jgi:hypothetical protein
MRTTVDIPDATYRQLKSKAASEGTTVKALVMRGVEVVLSAGRPQRQKKLKLPILDSSEPGTLDIDNERIYDILGFP